MGWTWVVGAVVLVAVVVWLVLRLIACPAAADSAAPILSARFARGEIDAEEYARMGAVLGRPGVGLVVVGSPSRSRSGSSSSSF